MGRIRTIKPEFPQSETTGELSRDARLLFILIWTICDDEGRFRGSSRMLASLLFPYDDDAPDEIGGWLDELERKECIRRYAVEGATYGEVINWLKHQKIDRPSKSRLPAFGEPSRTLATPREPSATDLGPRTLDQGPTISDHGASPAVACATAAMIAGDLFVQFWKEYPKRDGANPKEPARNKFLAFLKSGENPDTIIAGVRAYAVALSGKQQINTQYVAQASTWLDERRWEDYAPSPVDEATRAAKEEHMIARGYKFVEPIGWQKNISEVMQN